jgi:outer membrane protein assembly factor BamB
MASDGSHIFIGSAGATIKALSMNGEVAWSTEFGGEIDSNIFPIGSGLLFSTSALATGSNENGPSTLRSISKETGVPNWTMKLPAADRHFIGGSQGSAIVVSMNGVIQSVDAKSGTMLWKREIADGFAAAPMFDASSVVVATTGKQIFVISLVTGQIDLMRKVPYRTTAVARQSVDTLIIGDERGNVTSFINGSEKANWRFKGGGEISGLSVTENSIVAVSHDNFIYLLAQRNGGVTWRKRMAGRAANVAELSGQYVVVSGTDDNGAQLIGLRNGKIAGQIALEEGETLFQTLVTGANGSILVMTNRGVYSYDLNNCSQKNNAAPAQ